MTNKVKPKIAVFGGSFNPPGLHHRKIVEQLAKKFDQVLIVPCGFRPDKLSAREVSPKQRKRMIELTFVDLPGVEVLYFDLDAGEYTRTFDLDKRLGREYDGELWHAIGTDIIQGGSNGRSEIHQSWHRGAELWKNLRFAIISRQDVPASPADFPRQSQLIHFNNIGSSTEIRKRIVAGENIDHLVYSGVSQFIEEEGLYLTTNMNEVQ